MHEAGAAIKYIESMIVVRGGRAHGRRRDKGPAISVGHNVATPFTRPKMGAEADEMGKGLKKKARLAGVT